MKRLMFSLFLIPTLYILIVLYNIAGDFYCHKIGTEKFTYLKYIEQTNGFIFVGCTEY